VSDTFQAPTVEVPGLNPRLYGSLEGEKMKLESNQISRDWTVLHDGRKYYVNYTQSDTQTLALCNRDNWEVLEETDKGPEELDIYGFERDCPDGQSKANSDFRLMKKLIRFCIGNWDNRFMIDIKEDLEEQKEALKLL
jgi:hypothetical protein